MTMKLSQKSVLPSRYSEIYFDKSFIMNYERVKSFNNSFEK